MEVWNVANARADMEQCREIDPGLNAEVEAQLNHLDKVLAKKEKDEREKYKGKLFT